MGADVDIDIDVDEDVVARLIFVLIGDAVCALLLFECEECVVGCVGM